MVLQMRSNIIFDSDIAAILPNAFNESAKKSSQIVICSAYINGDLIAKLLRLVPKRCQVTVITSCSYSNSFSGLSDLVEAKKMKLYLPDHQNGQNEKTQDTLMHIKSYCFKIGNKWTNYVGSMNFTKAGIYKNIELLCPIANQSLAETVLSLANKRNAIGLEQLRLLEESNKFAGSLMHVESAYSMGQLCSSYPPLRKANEAAVCPATDCAGSN
jgi:HKD family nuclease